jgi:hypothetical protein
MPFSQKCSIWSSCVRNVTSDPDLEAKVRFSPRLALDGSFLGGGVCPVEGGSGSLPRLPWRGGGRGKGVSGTQLPVTCLSWGGYRVLPWSHLMIRVGRPWNPLLMWVGPGPPGLSKYMLVLLTRLFFNPHTAYPDVGGTTPIFCGRQYFVDTNILTTQIFCRRLYFFCAYILSMPIFCQRNIFSTPIFYWRLCFVDTNIFVNANILSTLIFCQRKYLVNAYFWSRPIFFGR